MLRPIVDLEACQNCQPCNARSACNTRAIVRIDPDEPPYIAVERCNGCSACVLACCCGAIHMRQSGAVAVGWQV